MHNASPPKIRPVRAWYVLLAALVAGFLLGQVVPSLPLPYLARWGIGVLVAAIVASCFLWYRVSRSKRLKQARSHDYRACPHCMYPMEMDARAQLSCPECGLSLSPQSVTDAWEHELKSDAASRIVDAGHPRQDDSSRDSGMSRRKGEARPP